MPNTKVWAKPQDPAALAQAPIKPEDLHASNTQAFAQQASKQASTVDQRARSTDKQAKPSSNRQASMDPGTSFKHP